MAPRPVASAVIGLSGMALTEDEALLLAEQPPLGVILFSRNIENPAQVSDLAASIRAVVPAALMLVDQEGGRVARMRPPAWRAHPPAAEIGRLHARDAGAGLRAATLTGALIGLDCAAVGFDVVCAPVLDRAVEGADAVIGDRAFSSDPESAAALGRVYAEGLLEAGVQPVGKHVPGHGRALVDSHAALPDLDDVDEADLLPFHANAWLPWMMTAHIRYRALDPDRPATLSGIVLEQVVRRRLGFDGLLLSDDLCMHAVTGDAGALAAAAVAAGCDVALHCSGVLAQSRAVLEAAGAVSSVTRRRLQAAAALAAGRCRPLDGPALAAERAVLLG